MERFTDQVKGGVGVGELIAQYVDDSRSLARCLDDVARADRLAVDTEADSLHHYFNKVCLIQIACGGQSYVVDPLAGIDLTALLELLAHKPLVLHGADFDLRMLRSGYGFRPHGALFDTMLAAQLVGIRSFGLAALVKSYFNVTLSKQGQKSNWSRRPLTPQQLDYAIKDTHYLLPLADYLSDELRELGRYSWHEESCAWLVKATERESTREPDRAWRIKGLKDMTRRQLAFVKEIWRWRENEARRADIPPFKIMGEHQMREIALWAEKRRTGAYGDMRGLPRNCVGRRFERLKHALMKADRMPSSRWPRHLKPQAKPRRKPVHTKPLRVECERLAKKLNIEPAVLATRATLEALARGRPASIEEIMDCGPTMRWQAEILQPSLMRLYHGAEH